MLEKLSGDHLRRRLQLMLKNTRLLVISAALLATGSGAVVYYGVTQPSVLRIAVGPPGSEDVRLVQAMAQYLVRERAPVRLRPVIKAGPVESGAALDAREVELAIVRRDLGLPKDGQVVVIFRKNYAVLVAKPAAPAAEEPAAAPKGKKKAAAKPAKAAAPKKAAPKKAAGEESENEKEEKSATDKGIEKIEDLPGRRLGVIGRTQANIRLLDVILQQYSIKRETISITQFDVNTAAAAIREGNIDAVLAVGPLNSRITADAINALSGGKGAPTFIPLNASEAIAQGTPLYETAEIPAGAFGGSPQRPEDTVETISFAHYLVARKTIYDGTIGDLTKSILNSRQSVAVEVAQASKIEAPDTDKNSVVAVHPGAAAYVDGNQQTVFDRYGDLLYWGLMLCSFIGSAAAGILNYAKADDKERITATLERSLEIAAVARQADTVQSLNALRSEMDEILASVIRDAEQLGLSETQLRAFGMAGDQAFGAIAERRSELARRTSPLVA